MADISVIILTFNEELHIERCIRNVQKLGAEVFLVDSYSTDRTTAIAESLGATVFQNKWDNNHAKQFNWALENLPITTKWVLRLDADEYLLDELIDELLEKTAQLDDEITGVVFKRRHIFLGRWIKRGTYPVKLLRLFRFGKATCEQRWMDEHIQLLEGTTTEFGHDFVDHNLNTLSWWSQKHVGYAVREAVDLLDTELGLFPGNVHETTLSPQALRKRKLKLKYARKPLFLRSFAYFIYRYFFKLGFTEGKEGFLWHFLQGWWYRTLVDATIYEIKKNCGKDPAKIRAYIREKYGLDV